MPDSISIWTWGSETRRHDSLEALYAVHDNYTRSGQDQLRWKICLSSGMNVEHDLEDVEDFQPTDFRSALLGKPTAATDSTKSKKKRRFDIESCIPEPRYIPWPDDPGKPRQRLSAIKPHRIRHAFVQNIERLLSEGHKRFSWIIPVNGKLKCSVPLTSGVMVFPGSEEGDAEVVGDEKVSRDVMDDLLVASQVHGTKDRIAWTPADLLLFWLWLRDTRKESITGSISLSFTSMEFGDEDEGLDTTQPSWDPPSIVRETPPNPSNSQSKDRMHYIALYHDASQSLVLRSYFGSFNTAKMWKVLKEESRDILRTKGFGEPVVERSVLKNARILLADESGRGVLIS
ncbi:hypothetical protein FRB90_005013 [Tulasnella sp. 427]|nr:hypothetical protein FRB90_005013 [Tulasnella sp. 427]